MSDQQELIDFLRGEAESVAAEAEGPGGTTVRRQARDEAEKFSRAATALEAHQGLREALTECEEALRSANAEYEQFRERMLAPLNAEEGDSIESLSWDDLLGVAVRNLNEGMRLDTLVRRAAPFVNAVVAMADDKTPGLAWLADAALDQDPCPTCGGSEEDVSISGEPRSYDEKGRPLCFDCGKPQDAPGIPAICAAWHTTKKQGE